MIILRNERGTRVFLQYYGKQCRDRGKHGFRLVSTKEEKDRLLVTYWTVPLRQRDTSVVLVYGGYSERPV